MIAIGIILMIISLTIFIIMCIMNSYVDDMANGFFLGWFAGLLLLFGIVAITSKCKITPMDVYQGKTTLEYTVKDGVVVDSTVVWKNK